MIGTLAVDGCSINQSINQKIFNVSRITNVIARSTGCYIWYSEAGPGRAAAPPSHLPAALNVTAHPSTASVPTSFWCGAIIAVQNQTRISPVRYKDGLQPCLPEKGSVARPKWRLGRTWIWQQNKRCQLTLQCSRVGLFSRHGHGTDNNWNLQVSWVELSCALA